MIIVECKFDPFRDQKPVEQFGFIDLKSALENSVVPSQMPGADEDYNGIDDPSKVLGTPRDIFEAIDAQKAFESSVSSVSGDDSPSEDS